MKNTISIIISGLLVFGAVNTLFACEGSKKVEQTSTQQSMQSAQALPAANTSEPVAVKASGSCAMSAGEAKCANAEVKSKDSCGASGSCTADASCGKCANVKAASDKNCQSGGCSSEAKGKCTVKAQANSAQVIPESSPKKAS